jgi:hypothetical protein
VRWIVAWSDPLGALAVIAVLFSGLVTLLGSGVPDQRRQLRRSRAISRRLTNSTHRPSVALPRRRMQECLALLQGRKF